LKPFNLKAMALMTRDGNPIPTPDQVTRKEWGEHLMLKQEHR
jgi:hypothetical protein